MASARPVLKPVKQQRLPPTSSDMANLSLNDNDGSSWASDQDTLAPLPLSGATPWPLLHSFPSFQYSHPYSSQPPPYHELSPNL